MNHFKRKTKIIATVGPACNTYEKLVELYKCGVNVFRINFSHSTHAEHLKVIEYITQLNDFHHANVAILADLQGPKLRVGLVQNNAIELKDNETILVTIDDVIGTEKLISVTYPPLANDIKEGELILIDDGKIELKVINKINNKTVECTIVSGGILSSKKGFNLPDTQISLPSITEKDWRDIEFIIQQPVHWLALSFVRNSKEIIELKDYLQQKESTLKVIAKIEKPEAIKNIDAIIKASDAVMVARGDLGVEVAMEEMPIIQKNITKKCIEMAKPVIIATQVMESMIDMSRPTRAEITDVANAVFDGADCIMLSGETSVGKNPAKVIQTIDKIICRTEQENHLYYMDFTPKKSSPTFLSDAICFNACKIAEDVEAKAINGMTYSGYTAFMLASYRPKAEIFIFTSNKSLMQSLSLVWGVEVFYYNKFESTDETILDIIELLKIQKRINTGDIIINTASMPIKGHARTNMIKISYI